MKTRIYLIFFLLISLKHFAQWTPVGLQGYPVNKICIVDSLIYAASNSNGICRSTNGGLSWKACNKGMYDTISVLTPAAGKIASGVALTNAGLFASTNDSIFVSIDSAKHWSFVHAIEPGFNMNGHVDYLDLNQNNNVLFAQIIDYYGAGRISRSTDNGATWTNMPGFRACAFENKYSYFASNKISLSANNGSSYAIQSNTGLTNGWATDVCASDSSLIYTTTQQMNTGIPFVYRSTNKATSWQQVYAATGIGSGSFYNTIAAKGAMVAVGGDNFILSLDSGNTWKHLNGVGGYYNDLLFHDHYLYASTQNGIFRLDLNLTVGIKSIEKQDINSVAYPNPFTNNTIIEFDNFKKENYTLTLYDANGAVVQTINNITEGKVEIKREQLRSGLYFYRVYHPNGLIAKGKLIAD